jgi:hypothetical protein
MDRPAPGALFLVPLPDDRFAGGKVLAVEDDVVRVAVAAVLWDCPVEAAEVEAAPRAVDHVALRPEALAGARWLGVAPVLDPERAAGFAAWDALPAGRRPVVRAPFAALAAALVTTA